jgi:hypothetical protein
MIVFFMWSPQVEQRARTHGDAYSVVFCPKQTRLYFKEKAVFRVGKSLEPSNIEHPFRVADLKMGTSLGTYEEQISCLSKRSI